MPLSSGIADVVIYMVLIAAPGRPLGVASGRKGMMFEGHFERTGRCFFRWRSYFPLVFLAVVLFGMRDCLWPYGSHLVDQVWEAACLTISLLGLGIRVLVAGSTPKGTSGRNSRRQKASVLNTTGAYSLVRHPLYLGNFFIGLGMSSFPRDWWVSVLYLAAFWIFYQPIVFVEEEFLKRKFGDKFVEWAARTPAFVPRLRGWRPPPLGFSLRTVLKREHSTLFVVVLTFAGIEEVGSVISTGRLENDLMWIMIFGIGLAQYAVLRSLKKDTRLLNVQGR
jgi:protein-S-isoprenylcysteine O-methyltransferase Ste14